jgi:multicomponent Na+:H+ antiporter subunit E
MKIFRTIGFLFYYIWELTIASCRIAWDVLTPTHKMKPAFLIMELDDLKDHQLLILSNLTTMTPGTLSMELSDDKRSLILHIMYLEEDVESFKKNQLKSFEDRVRRAF